MAGAALIDDRPGRVVGPVRSVRSIGDHSEPQSTPPTLSADDHTAAVSRPSHPLPSPRRTRPRQPGRHYGRYSASVARHSAAAAAAAAGAELPSSIVSAAAPATDDANDDSVATRRGALIIPSKWTNVNCPVASDQYTPGRWSAPAPSGDGDGGGDDDAPGELAGRAGDSPAASH